MNPTRWIERYKILTQSNTEALEDEVERYIKNGWQPYGPLLTTMKDGWTNYAQVIVDYA